MNDTPPTVKKSEGSDLATNLSSSEEREPALLDLRGETCPYTFVYTRLRLEEMPMGATLTVLVDHEPAIRNVPRSAAEWGQAVEAVEPAADQGVWRIVLRKRV